jgi:hypothetical protein
VVMKTRIFPCFRFLPKDIHDSSEIRVIAGMNG